MRVAVFVLGTEVFAVEWAPVPPPGADEVEVTRHSGDFGLSPLRASTPRPVPSDVEARR